MTKEKKKKSEKSESELVHDYVKKVIRGKQSRGHVDQRFAYTKSQKTVNKELWLDTDFFFSVVFQSEKQKYEFLQKLGIEADNDGQIQILNGLQFAKKLGIDLEKESALPYPTGSIDLMPLILDTEEGR